MHVHIVQIRQTRLAFAYMQIVQRFHNVPMHTPQVLRSESGVYRKMEKQPFQMSLCMLTLQERPTSPRSFIFASRLPRPRVEPSRLRS